MLGASLGGQRKYAEAEPLLLSGYGGMILKESTISPAERSNIAEAGDRIVKLYQNWDKPDVAAEWLQKLQQTGAANYASQRP
jgi:hypothetical protein